MSCHCSKNRNRLALLADQCSDENLPEEIRRILVNCPTCREHYAHLCDAMCCLQKVHGTDAPLEKSLWPDLNGRLPETQVRSSRYSQWKQQFVPIFSVTTACLALLLVFVGERPSEKRVYQTAINRNTTSLPIPSLSIDYSASPYQDFIFPAMQTDPFADQFSSLPRGTGIYYLREATPRSVYDFSDFNELEMKEFLKLKRRIKTLDQ